MTVGAQTDTDFAFRGIPEIKENGAGPVAAAAAVQAAPEPPLGNLVQLPGKWVGHGFNAIWRPHHPDNPQDRFLELNLTNETLVFSKINGPIPNRGLLMHDINMFGMTYMQQISEKSNGAGLHIEPGIWAHVPKTSAPNEPQTVVRMASIPHGTVILAQGTGKVVNGPPQIHDNDILPFPIGGHAQSFNQEEQVFTELNLAQATQFRFKSPGVTQAMVKNPNSVLRDAIQGQNIKKTVVLQITTKHNPIKGGGTANTAFLQAAGNPPTGNAKAVEVDATFWIETVANPGHPDKHQLQYTQLVQLDFNGLRWPHVTVATLQKQ